MNHHASSNRVYRLLWSEASGAWMPVAETAKGRGKAGRSRAIANRNGVAAAISLALSPLGHAAPPTTSPAAQCVAPACGAPAVSRTTHPLGAQVVAGTASITQSGDTTDIRQSSTDLSIDWLSFNVGPQATVDFIQPSAAAVAVNRISGSNGSQILGHLDANGQVWLINPNGVVFGQGSVVDVGGLVASTLEAADSGINGNTTAFAGAGTGGVVNQGTINAAPGGYVALLGNHVGNQGVISATLGTVALGAGSAATLTFDGDRLVTMQVERSTLNNLASNGGLIQAGGGQVLMTAGARAAVLASVVNNTGVIEARTVENHEGGIELLGGMTAGTVNVGGTLDAGAPAGGNGGFIETSAAHVEIANGTRITTAAARGLSGTWLVDPTDFTVAPAGGDITGATLSSDLNSTNVTILSSNGSSPVTGGGSGGNINVNDMVSWSTDTTLTLTAANNVNVNSTMSASGATAGLVINPNTSNGSEMKSGNGTFNLLMGAAINLPNVSPTSTSALVIGGTPYTVINRLGSPGSTTATDLQGIDGNLAGNYALGSNIDATATSTWNAGAGFSPLGTFTGTFNGLGHTISKLTINRPSSGGVGLFSGVDYGTVENVGLVGGSVTGGYGVGALVANLNYGSVSNSYATASVSGSNVVGGLVGSMVYGSISGSFATGAVRGGATVGGLLGFNLGYVYDSYATGSVMGLNSVGGLVGYTQNLGGRFAGSIYDSYATGAVSGGSYAGGLVGLNHGYGSADYSTGKVSGTTNLGGLVGGGYGVISSSFWNTTTSGQSSSATGKGLTTAQMQTAANFSGFTFTTTPGASGNNWVMVDINGTLNNAAGAAGATFPLLASEYSTTIESAHQLQLMAMNPAASYTLGRDINMSATGSGGNVWGSAGFIPIGTTGSPFSGTFNGLGYSISNLTINLPAASNVGLFGYTGASSVIENVGLVGGTVSGYHNVGDLVGDNLGSISDSYASGSVVGASTSVGGLVGANAHNASISASYATGPVAGAASYDGGLVGFNGGIVVDSYAAGAVSGPSGVGGLVGLNNKGVVSNSFWDVTTSGQPASSGGIGMTTANMQSEVNFTSATSANGNVNPDWDFTNTWVMYNGDTYPLLRTFMTPLTVTANGGSVTYTGSAYNGSRGVTYSVTPNGNLFGTLSFSSTSGPVVNAGIYTVTPGGLYSDQQGYILSYGSGTITINPLASVKWVGGTSGNWSTASNWAGGAIPDFGNVLSVTIPAGDTVTYDAGMAALGTTMLSSLTDAGKLVMAAGRLTTTGNLTAAGYQQTGGTLDVGGTLSIDAKMGAVKLGDIDAGVLSITAAKGNIAQLAGTAVDVTGAASLTADNGTGGLDTIILAQAGDSFGGTVTAEGSAIALRDNTALTVVLDSSGATSLTAAGALNVSGTVGTTLTTKTTGSKHATTFGATTVGTSLNVTSTGAVTETSANILTVAGEGTTTVSNPNVTVNGVEGAEIPAP